MGRMKKILSSGLAFVLMLSTLLAFAGCGAKTPNETGDKSNTSTSAPSTSDTTSDADPTEKPREEVTLKWYMVGDDKKDYQEVFAKANELIKSKINATVDFQILPWATFADKMKMIITSGEEFDLCFTADWSNNYLTNASKGAFIELDDLIDQYAPAYKEIIPDFMWDGIRIGGKIYGLPNYQVSFEQGALQFNTELLEKYSLDVNNIKSIADMEPLLQAIKENEPDIYPAGGQIFSYLGLNVLMDGIMFINRDDQVQLMVDSPEWQAGYRMQYEWAEKGYSPQDVNITNNINNYLLEKKVFATSTTYKPGVEADKAKAFGYPVTIIPIGEPAMTSHGPLAALTAISTTSKNPDRALELMNLMMTDKELFNLLTYGIEGKHYQKVGENRIELLEASNDYGMAAWELGNQFLAYLLPGQADDTWEETDRINKESVPVPGFGFNFDREPVKTEIAAMEAVFAKYGTSLAALTLDPDEIIKALQQEYKQAGADKVIAEVTKQYDAWKETNKK